MGISYQASDIFNKMKLLSTIVAVASAANNWWPGQPGGAACGSQLTFESDSVAVNSTCTVKLNGFAAQHVSIPNCFNAGQGSFDSIDCEIVVGGGSLDVVVFWEQAGNDTWVDASTCGNWTDIDVSCSDNGAPPAGKLIGNIANNYHSKDDLVKLNFDVYGAGDDGAAVAFAIQNGEVGTIVNATCPSCGTITFDDNSVSITAGDGGELLNQIEVFTTNQLSNIKSTIA